MLAAAIQAFKGLSEKLKCQTMGIDFSDEVERSICPFQRIGFTSRRN
jgi:hypothetical protein